MRNCFSLEAMRSDISQRSLQRQLVCTKLTQLHVFLQFRHCGFNKLLNMTNLQLFSSSISRLLVFSMRIIESLSSHSATFLEERIAHLRLSLILNGMFPAMLQKPTRLPLNWSAGLMSQGVLLFPTSMLFLIPPAPPWSHEFTLV